MQHTLQVTKSTGESTTLFFKVLDITYLDQMLALQDEIIKSLPDKTWYVPTSSEEFLDYLSGLGTILGYVTSDNELAALGIYAHYGKNEHNYGYDLSLTGDDLLKVGQIDCTIVKESFRGNSLQKLLCQALEEVGKENNTPIMTATVSPDNIYSLNTFLKYGYEIKCDKLKYGGLRRFVLAKYL